MDFCATVPSSIVTLRSAAAASALYYINIITLRAEAAAAGECGTICACAYWTLPPPPDRRATGRTSGGRSVLPSPGSLLFQIS